MQRIEIDFASGQDFFNDYKFFLGALAIPLGKIKRRAKPGKRVLLHCRFGREKTAYDWPGLILDNAATTASNDAGYVIKFDDAHIDDVEQAVWSHTPGSAARRDARLEPMFELRCSVAHRGQNDTRTVHAQDFSASGCQLRDEREPARPFRVNDAIIIASAKGEISGRVRWVQGQRFGVVFDAPLPNVAGALWSESALARQRVISAKTTREFD